MQRRPSPSRWALWAFAAALLLQSAMPWLASTAAQWQGLGLGEVCTVYGVSLVQAGGHEHPDRGRHHPGEPGDPHCPLAAFAAIASGGPGPSGPVAVRIERAELTLPPWRSPALDACARWAARLEHGPPLHA